MRASVLLLVAVVCAAQAARLVQAQGAATLITIQFDNRKKSVTSPTNSVKIRNVLAQYVFMVPASQVTLVSGIDQSGVVSSQAVVVYRAVGPTTNGKSVLANCQAATQGRWLGLGSSPLEREIKKATDTWWPGDAIDVQKATCAASTGH